MDMRVISFVKRSYSYLATTPLARLILQAAVSIVLIALLVSMARQADLIASFRALQPGAIAIAAGLQGAAFVLNSWRWQILLANVGIAERLSSLTSLYFIGQFFSLFLPTGTGGDVVRTYDVARRSGRTGAAVVAMLQERLLGLGASLLIGFVAALYYLPIVPPQLRIWMVVTQIAGATGIALLFYPSLLFAIASWCWRAQGYRPALRSIAGHPLVARVVHALDSIRRLPPLRPLRFALLLGMAATAVLMGIGMYYVLGQSLDIHASFIAFCLIVPLVWIVRMAPVSLNGIGLGEGAFVFLGGLFAVPANKALALALAFLGIQTGWALFGGLLLALRMIRGNWVGARRPAVE